MERLIYTVRISQNNKPIKTVWTNFRTTDNDKQLIKYIKTKFSLDNTYTIDFNFTTNMAIYNHNTAKFRRDLQNYADTFIAEKKTTDPKQAEKMALAYMQKERLITDKLFNKLKF